MSACGAISEYGLVCTGPEGHMEGKHCTKTSRITSYWTVLDTSREDRLVELAKEVARYNPGCVGPNTYTPAMYGLAQAAVALLAELGVKDSAYED